MAPDRIFRWNFASVILVAAVAFWGCSKSEPLPHYMIGRWESENARYENCFVLIDETSIIFGRDAIPTLEGVITDVTPGKAKAGRHIIIEYEDQNTSSFKLEIFYDEAEPGRFWFVNQPDVVWERRIVAGQ